MSVWIEAPLGSVLDVVIDHRGRTPKKLGADWTNHGVRVISAINIKSGKLDLSLSSNFIERKVFERWMPEKLRYEDILMTSEAPLGSVAIFDREDDFCLGQRLFALRGDPSTLNQKYLFWVLQTPQVQQQLIARSTGTTAKGIRQSELLKVQILVPPIAEQKRIAAILDKAEELRGLRRKALEQLNAIAQSIFLEMFGDLRKNSKNWEVLQFKEVLNAPLRNGVSPSKSGKVISKVLTLSAITGNEFNVGAIKTSTFQSAPPLHQTVNECDFLICRGNGNIHLVGKGYFPTQSMPDVAFPDTIIAAQVELSRINQAFLEYIWNSSAVRLQIESIARTTNGTLKVNQTMLEGIALLLPPLSLQEKFARRVQAIEQLKTTHRESLTQLDALFASLQHRAFRGEL